MISNVNYIELYINKQLMELKSQDSLNLRINNVLFNPAEVSTTQAEYSFSFSIPSTPNNDKILNYANNLSKLNKFHARYPAEVYSDGNIIFSGSLTIRKYDASSKMYECNLVNIKINTLEDIFGDAVLSDVPWLVDFNGAETINQVNADSSSKYWFPLVSYGAFIKDPISADTYGVQDKYTSKYQIDRTNRWYISSFYPSLNVIEEMRKCFEWKGYSVGGSALYDPIISNIYASTNLADGQSPNYNIGNNKFGKLSLNVQWNGSSNLSESGNTNYFTQGLKFPYFPVGGYYDLRYGSAIEYEQNYNFSEVFINPLLKDGTVTISESSTMLIPDRDIIVIPADGFYKISLSATTNLTQVGNITATQFICPWDDTAGGMSKESVEDEISFAPDYSITTPLEIQLIRNYDDNIELIKGKNNIQVYDGNPSHTTQCDKGIFSNYFNYQTCFPHEAGGSSLIYTYCTDREQISDFNTNRADVNIGYMQNDNNLMCYDPVVSKAFICGFTTMGSKNGEGTTSFVKNGYSWSKTISERTDAMYYQAGYDKVWYDNTYNIHSTATTVNSNSLPNVPSRVFTRNGNTCTAQVNGIVYLNKNDILELMAVRRGYWNEAVPVTYGVSANINLVIEAASPSTIYQLRAKNYGWTSSNEFPSKLNLMNFTNNETKVKDWLQDIATAFNLSFEMSGENEVDININKGIKKTISYAVDIDERVNSSNAVAEYISYPKEMSVRYKIDTEEHGFYETVPNIHINDDDWTKWGDSGYTIIKLNDDSYETSTQNVDVQFSYTWYSNFSMSGESNSQIWFQIPVISKETYMIDGYDYAESMKHDGFNLSQRFWFRNNKRLDYPSYWEATLKDDWDYHNGEFVVRSVDLYVPVNQKDGFNLSYKDTETSIVTEYFNVYPMLASNFVTVDVFLNTWEYISIKDGALVHFDDDLYYTSEISGYDPSGSNPTQLKLIKKV